ncbi:MAG TPA: hypothetical protein VL263_21300, partial [Vicinamibacterales bacterium]|nr:hypothetical protein [Vicinamibacterales bacterium]
MYRCLASSSTSLRRYRRVVLTLTIALIGSAAPVAAQSLGWVLDTSPATATQPYRPIRLLAVNVATGIEVARFDPPAGVQFGWNGVVTPDGRYYLLATSAGIARFRTTPASFDRIVGPAVPVESLVVSPAGRDLHAFGPQGHAVVDWETGTVLSTECCRNPGIAFTPDGTVRIEHRLRLRSTDQVRTIAAYREATGELLWENEIYLYYSCSGMAATNSYVAFFCTDWETTEIIVWDIASGTQNSGFQNIWAPYLAWHGDRLLLSMEDLLSSALRLSSYDPRTGQLTIIAERPGPPLSMTASVVVSPDNRHAYWQTNHHPPRVGIDSTLYDVIDLASDTVVGTGRLPGFQFGLAISAALACHFNLPATVAAPIEGGMVGIPVVPDPACTGWSVPDQPSVLNPGPHIGPVTLLVQTWANAEASEK